MLETLQAPDYGTRRVEEEDGDSKDQYSFAPRNIEAITTPGELDLQFDSLFERLSLCKNEEQRDVFIQECGRFVGIYIDKEAQAIPKGRLDIKGDVRGLASLQGFLERELIKRGARFSQFCHDPNFISAINKEASFAHAEKINEKLRGAESVHSFVELISKKENVIFIGSEVNLDTRHAIDLVVGLTENPKSEKQDIDEIMLVQVKTQVPSNETISGIVSQHRNYAKALREFEGLAVGTPESANSKKRQIEMSSSESILMASEGVNFYKKILGINSELDLTWDSFVRAGEKYMCDPVYLYMQLRQMDEMSLKMDMKAFQINSLKMARKKAELVDVPQGDFAKYNRIIRGNSHITGAKKIRSVIVGGGGVVREEVLM